MPSPNKYTPEGPLYGGYFKRTQSSARYLVRGYINPKRSFEWYGESRLHPVNMGIKKANRRAEALGLKFRKADFWK